VTGGVYRERVRFPALRPRLAALIWHPRVVVSVLALLLLALPLGVLTAGHDHRGGGLRLTASTPGVHRYGSLTSDTDFRRGRFTGTASANGTVMVTGPVARRTWAGRGYEYGSWTSAWISPGLAFTQLIPSWNAATPPGAWMQVFVQVRTGDGRVSGLKDLGRWATRDGIFHRSSAGAQSDAIASVATDTLRARAGVSLTSYRFTVRLMRLPGRAAASLRSIGAVVSRMPAGTPVTSAPLRRSAVTLAVPAYSQMIHRGQNPEYGGGGEAWCSPTSLAMVLGYYGKLPRPAEYAWAPYREAWVNQVARLTYDWTYRGTGNWPFNTAIGAGRVGDAFVTRLPSLRAAERYVRAGIPLIVSIRFSRGQLTGAPISSTPGHLLVLVGFTATGRPVVNDPAAPSDAGVRRSYDRGQFERAWLTGSAGMAYVVHDTAHPLP
jgi:hypothetical protein